MSGYQFSFKGHTGPVRSVAISPDGQRLASGSWDSTIKLWNRATGQQLFVVKVPAGSAPNVAFGPDGKCLASVGYDNTVKIWDSATGKRLSSFEGHTGAIGSVAFSLDGQRLASMSDDNTVRIWNRATGKELFSLKFEGPPDQFRHAIMGLRLAFSPDGQCLAAGNDDGTVKIWHSVTGKELFSLEGHGNLVTCVAFSPDGQRLASGSMDNTVRIWHSATGKELFSLKGRANGFMQGVECIAFSPDSQRLAAGYDDSRVTIWDSTTGQELLSVEVGDGVLDGSVMSLAFSPDGQSLACSNNDGSISLLETSVSPEVQERRAVHQRVAELFGEVGLREDVLERLRTTPGMSPTRRKEAVEVAQTYLVDPSTLNDLAGKLVKLPGRAMADYRKALRFAEEADRLEPEHGGYQTTLGMACFRVGNDKKALEVLLRANAVNQKQYPGSHPTDLAFLAMTQHRLGHAPEAQAHLKQLRERMKGPGWAQNAEAKDFLREAEALLAKPTTPGDK